MALEHEALTEQIIGAATESIRKPGNQEQWKMALEYEALTEQIVGAASESIRKPGNQEQ
jgi:hypothetical protein